MLATLVYAVLIAYPPIALFYDLNLALFELLSLSVSAVGIYMLSKLAGSFRSVLSLVIVNVALFFFSTTFCFGALLTSVIAAVPILSFICLRSRSALCSVMPFAVTVAVYLLVSLLIGDYTVSLFSVALLPAAIMMIYSISSKASRIGTICRVSFGLLLSLALAAALWFVGRYGWSASLIPSVIDGAREALTGATFEACKTALDTAGLKISTADLDEICSYSVTVFFNFLPAIAVIGANLLSFFLQRYTAEIVVSDDSDKETLHRFFSLEMSTASAVVFLVSAILGIIFSADGEDIYATATMNVMMILMPGLIYTAMITLRRFAFAKRASCLPSLVYFGAILLFFNRPAIAIVASSLAGASIIISTSIKKAINKKEK